jgi:hypothetical protein
MVLKFNGLATHLILRYAQNDRALFGSECSAVGLKHGKAPLCLYSGAFSL